MGQRLDVKPGDRVWVLYEAEEVPTSKAVADVVNHDGSKVSLRPVLNERGENLCIMDDDL